MQKHHFLDTTRAGFAFLVLASALLLACSPLGGNQPSSPAVTSDATNAPRLSLQEESISLGTISSSQSVREKVERLIEFNNTGTQPLVIQEVLVLPPPGG